MTNAKKLLICRSVTLLLLLARESLSIFFNQTSFIKTKPLDLTKQFTLSFRTCQGGTLIHQTGDNNDYFELVVVRGAINYTSGVFTNSSLALRWQATGSPNVEAINVGNQLDQNRPYQVEFSPRTSSQNATLSTSLGSLMHTIQVPETIYNVSAKNLTLGQGFVGCITFNDVFDLKNVYENVSTSEVCPLDSGERCKRQACPSGYKGYYCETDIDDCASSPCHHAATCVDKVANYSCECGPAWYGRNCDMLKDTTFCDHKPCANGGICQHTSNFNNYTCTCPVPYTGRNCTDIADPCKSMPCRNNATCTNIRNVTFQCICPKGFTGKHCETNIDDCESADCGNGQCNDGIAAYSCNCTGSGYKPPDCKVDVNECTNSTPCMNNATCSNYAGGYLCTCVGDFQGKNCEEKIDDCLAKPCQNGGNCTDLVKDFKCVCPAGFSGNRCEIQLHSCNVKGCTACDDSPCRNGECNCSCTADTMFYNCTCEEGYYGAKCDQDIDECVNGSIPTKICGDNGTCRNTNGSFKCVCSEGFVGKYCNETEGPCNPDPCVNGECHRINVTINMSSDGGNSSYFIESYNCSCDRGWKGRNCTEDIDECEDSSDNCNTSTSSCVNTEGGFRCSCFSGYGGKDCTDVNECKTIAPCMHGICKNNDGDYECFCPNGFAGKNCSNNIDDCQHMDGHSKCKNGACRDAVAAFTCECNIGWTGTFCDVDIDECKLGYCVNGTCNNTQGSYVCTCSPGFTNMNCSVDIDDCEGSPCLNGGTCRDKVNDYECDCSPCYEGKSCEVPADRCDYGICENGPLNYTCQCFDGFSGRNCSIDKDECTSMPCKNNATCVQKSNVTAVEMYFGADRVFRKNESGGYLCVCQPGFNGSNCENNINECLLYQACNDTGTESCDDGVNNYTCICDDGFTGRNCSEDIDECSPSPCQNNGTCQNLVARYNCICDSNHTGVNCEILIDPCTALKPCRNGATCEVISDYNYTCSCAEGFAGTRCTDRTTLGFDGTSSMSVNVPQTTANVSFSFQTIFSEGVLVSVVGKWVLALVSGKLELMCKRDSSSCEIGDRGMFTDSNWHGVKIIMNGLSITAKAGSGQASHNCTRECVSSRRRRNAPENQLVVGANSEDSNLPQFVGSIRDFSVNDVKYYPGVSGVNTHGLASEFQRQNVCSPDPCVNGVCKDLWTRYFCECERNWTSPNCTEAVQWGTFGAINQLKNGYRPTSNRSYASYFVDTTFQNLAFTVRTRSKSTLIIQLKSSSSMVLSVEINDNGFLQIREKNDTVNLQPREAPKINDAVAHYVYINHSVIHVDNMTYDVMVTSLPVKNVFVGGLPANVDAMSAHEQFRGCISDVRLNGEQLLFFNQTASRLNSSQENIAVGCSGEDVCANISGSSPCSNRGNCTDIWNDFRCECQSPYGGDSCELYGCEWAKLCPGNGTCVNLRETSEYECINEVTFNHSHSSAFFRNSTPLSDVNSLVAQFRTTQNDTVILSSVLNASFFELAVNDGRAKVMYSFAENMTEVVNTDILISDGNWHELKIESTSSQTRFMISAMEQQQDKFSYLNNHSFSQNISLLNESFASLLSTGGVYIGSSPINSTRESLLGCLREVRLGKHLLTFTGNTSVEMIPALSLASSAFSSAGVSNVRIGCHSNVVCTDNLCGNGTCVQRWNDIRCACPVGHSGDRCQFNTCTSSPCVTGTCTVSDNSFRCTCGNNYVGVYCNETCTQGFCKNGGKCEVSGDKITCTCESDWTGQFCESAVPRDDNSDDEDNLPLIIGLAVGGGVLLLVVVAVIFLCTRQTSQTFGTYSPSSEEKVGARVEMNPVLNVPPPEKLI